MRQKRQKRQKSRREKRNREVRGSLTVELTLIMPILLAVILLALYAGLYFHDCTVTAAAAAETARRCRLEVLENVNMDTGQADWELLEQKGILWRLPGQADSIFTRAAGDAAAYARRSAAGRMTVCSSPSFSASATAKSATVSWSISAGPAGFFPWQMFQVIPGRSGSVTLSGEEAEELVRLVHAMEKDQNNPENQRGSSE